MKIFVSWSGARSQALAQTLRDWLPLVLHYVEPWLSDADLAAGERWAQALAKELETSNFGIICVTRENVSSPWILFEAGSLAKSLEGSRVIPLLLDVELSEISGPLAQFQAKKAERSGLEEVVQSINQVAPHPVPDARMKQLFDALWPEFEKQVAAIPAEARAKPIRPQHEILEELVASVRGLESRLREVQEVVLSDSFRPIRQRRRIDPFLVHELPRMLAEGPDDPVIILVLSSFLREDMPWLYELAVDAYRSIRNGASQESSVALRRFRRALEFGLHGPARELFGDSKMLHMVVREMERSLHLESGEIEEQDTAQRRKREPKSETGGS